MNAVPRPLLIPFVAATGLLSLLVGCSSTSRDSSEELATHKQATLPTMAGETDFFDGKFLVEVKLGRGFRPRPQKGFWTSDSRPLTEENEKGEEVMRRPLPDDDDYFIPRMHNSILPPQALRIRVTNQTATAAEIGYNQCDSSLGNFSVRPATIKIEPGQSHEPDAMISLLGASGEDLPVKVGLVYNGRVETKIVTLKLVAKPHPPEAPAKK